MNFYRTLSRSIEVRGIGLHSGREISLRLCPDERPGWRFRRLDLPCQPEVPATLENVTSTQHATLLQSGAASVSTPEHLLAALWSLDVTHARIELDGPEVPILDGSAAPWVEAIGAAGTQKIDGERPVWALAQPVWWQQGSASVIGLPSADFRVCAAVDFDHPHAGAQIVAVEVNAENFARELAPARTFTLEAWLEPLRAAGLIRGGSLENAVLVTQNGLSSPPRLDNEMARHKALDCIGDLALLFGTTGALFQGQLVANRAGHGPHRNWMEKCRNLGALIRV
ncbi:MAG TPA: UDP-3-O-acyl-N-acetylglucosamine deacetylase [Abditibacterium sp.]|jgi:UDP-3-O-[3-hydroxymyristoyl] N-acetylglucosamine deacetylase